MKKRNLLGCTALSALASLAIAMPAAAQQLEDEIIVTATKKGSGVSMQDVPLAVQAIDAKALGEQGITDFADYVQNLPNINAGGRGPGQNEIYIRGAAVDAINITVAESQGSAPNVALYLDEQPVTAGGRNLDVYISDMERIEVLPGPQGTLYGASSMAGTVRLITAKPDLSEFKASMGASYSFTKDGDDSNSVEAMINVPIVEDKFAIRVAAYSDRKGGYIDNVLGTIAVTDNGAPNPSIPGINFNAADPNNNIVTGTHFIAGGTVLANGTVVPVGGQNYAVSYERASNASLVEDNFNDASYNGIRFGAKYAINNDWDILVQHSRQALETEGVFDYDPSVGDLDVTRFVPDSLNDDFNQTAWTVSGRLSNLDLVYTGAYLDRNTDSNIDYTGYSNVGGYIPGYFCEYFSASSFYSNIAALTGTNNGYNFDPTIGGNRDVIECGTPVNEVQIRNTNTRWTHEFRANTDWDFPVNLSAGVYFEDFEITHVGDFNYGGSSVGNFDTIDISRNAGVFGAARNGSVVFNPSTQFRNDNLRTEKQFALFGEASWDISEQFNVTVGARYYDLDYNFEGYGAFRYGGRIIDVPGFELAGPDGRTQVGGRDYSVNLGELAPIKTSDTILKVTGTYKPNDDMLFYATWSEGYRPPGINRGAARSPYVAGSNNTYTDLQGNEQSCGPDRAVGSNQTNGFPGYCLPYIFESDTLENIELGWKTTLMDNRMRLNGAIYQIDWNNIQTSHFDSQNISIFTLVDNAGDAKIKGIEADMVFQATDNLTVSAAGSFNDTELVGIDPAFAFVVADVGSALPLTPKVQLSARGRYEWDTNFFGLADTTAFGQIGGKYAGTSVNSLVDTATEPQEEQSAYFLLDAAVGLGSSEDGWNLELFAKNITDERAELHINRQDFIKRVTTNRPRTMGVRVRQDF